MCRITAGSKATIVDVAMCGGWDHAYGRRRVTADGWDIILHALGSQ